MLNKIKSKYIVIEIFEMMKNKRKMKIIKYNKSMAGKLDITTEDFKAYEILREFNQEHNLNIEDIDINILDLSGKNSGNEIFEDLNRIKLKRLENLNLSNNNISDINNLEKEAFNT